jgi:hypothetical protein
VLCMDTSTHVSTLWANVLVMHGVHAEQTHARNTQHARDGMLLAVGMHYARSAGCEQHMTPVCKSYNKGTIAECSCQC